MTENKKTTRKIRNNIQQSKKVKKWSSVWWKWLLIWIGVFFILIIWIIFFFFFYLVKNPSVGKWLWLSISAIKSITSVFAGIFFWTFFILFLILCLSYLYKLTTKTTWKFKNAIWVFITFIIWLINLVSGFYIFKNIYSIKDDSWPATNEVLIANVIFSKNNQPTPIPLFSNNYPLIWPIAISFQLNKRIFNQIYIPQITKQEWWNIKLIKFSLNCGNWQIITYKSYDFSPYKYCLYLKKWIYTAKLDFTYMNINWQIKTLELPSKNIEITSNIWFKTPIKLNDKKNEIVAAEVWDKIKLDITKIPLDLWLTKNDIFVDFLWNWNFQKYKWLASFSYNEDGLYNIQIKIPNLNYPTYTFPLRVLPSTKPTCNISYNKNNNKYIINVNTKSPNWPVVKYTYNIINLSTNNIIKKWNKNRFTIYLANWSNYEIKYKIKDVKWKIWKCSQIIRLSDKVTYQYNVKIQAPYGNIITWIDNIFVNVKQIPSEFTIKIEDIFPKSFSDVWFDIDNDWQIDNKSNNLQVKFIKKENRTISTIVKDQYWNQAIKNIHFKINLQPIIAILKSDKYKGSAPLTVKFDASSSYTTNSWDSIAFFHWDFWDGIKQENTRQWVIIHTYKKPWKYIAKINIETDLGYTWQAAKKIIVFKPVNTANIIFPNNLWWQIQVEEPLQIQLNTTWPVKSINWNFWDGNTLQCEWKECININHTYYKTWLFTIKAKITYLDWSPSTTISAKINVINN